MEAVKINDQRAIQMNEKMQPIDAYSMTIQILDTQIKYYNNMYIRDWERNHTTEKEFYDEKIKNLKNEKSRILALVKNAKEQNQSVSFNYNLNLEAV